MSDNSSEDGSGNERDVGPERRDLAALKGILAHEPELFINLVGQPMVLLPIAGERNARVPNRLESRRVRAELVGLIYDSAGFLPFEQEVTRILRYLEGQAWKNPRISVEYAAAVDQHPIVEAVHILAYSLRLGSVHESTATKLLKELNDIARANGIDVQQNAWPKAANSLSEQLEEVKEMLATGGLAFSRHRSNGVRWIKLTRIRIRDDDDASSALDRPESKPPAGNELLTSGKSAGRTESVFSRIQSASNGASI